MMEWIRINETWVAEDGDISITVRWSRGAWHWRAVFCTGAVETAQFAGDNKQDYPNGFIDAESARQSAERWFEHLASDR